MSKKLILDTHTILRLMDQRKKGPKDMASALGITEAGWYKIIREKSTKDSTVLKIADALRVHRSVIVGERMDFEDVNIHEPQDSPSVAAIVKRISSLEAKYDDLQSKYTKLLEKLSGV